MRRYGGKTLKEINMAILKRNTGINAQRFAREPLEKLFAAEWDKRNRTEHGRRPTLPYLLDPTNQHDPCEPTKYAYQIAATIIQWLGGPVGQGFIEDVMQKAEDRKIPTRLKAKDVIAQFRRGDFKHTGE